MSLSFVCPDLHKSECDSLKCLLSLLKLMHINFSFTSECGVDFPKDSEWAGHGLGLQVNTNEWREQLEAIQALANSKLGIACYSCTVAFSHNLPLCCSSALSLPLAYTHSHNSLCLSLFRPRSRPHSLFTSRLYLPNVFNALIVAMFLSKCQVFSCKFSKCHRHKRWFLCIVSVRYICWSTSSDLSQISVKNVHIQGGNIEHENV